MSAQAPAGIHASGACELPELFGSGLVGVLHPARDPTTHGTAVILFNAGLVHRVGPHRGTVQLARTLADQGYPVLRFDQAGLGDTAVATTASADPRLDELRAAIELLAARTGARRFVIGGICSAADAAFRLASLEPRVHGVLSLDGPGYRTTGFWWRHLLPRLIQPAKAWRWWRARAGGAPGMQDFRDFPERDAAASQLAAMVQAGTQLLFLYTGGAYRYYNHAGQLRAALGPVVGSPRVTLAYWPDCDHTFYLQRDRERLGQLVLAWLQQAFAATLPA